MEAEGVSYEDFTDGCGLNSIMNSIVNNSGSTIPWINNSGFKFLQEINTSTGKENTGWSQTSSPLPALLVEASFTDDVWYCT